MGLQMLYTTTSIKYGDAILSKQITMDEALDKIWNSYFTKPKVSQSAFLDLCRKYDPDFAPISSQTERQQRADLSKKVRDGYRNQIARQLYEIDPKIKKQFSGKIERNQHAFFRGLTVEEQEELARKITGDDREKVLAQLYAERVLSKKDKLFALLDMSDAELADHFFNYLDELELVREIEQYRDFSYTDEQRQALEELFLRMTELSSLDTRIDMIGGAYYADYPCEQLQMGVYEGEEFREELLNLALRSGEKRGDLHDMTHNKGEDALAGPTVDLATNFGGLRGFAFGTLDQKMEEFVKTYGVTSLKDCAWATQDGIENASAKIIDSINKRELIFVDIPKVGLKALRSSGGGISTSKPVEATKEDVLQQMVKVAEKGVNRVDAANPFFLAKFTGSDQYNQMAAQHKAVKEMAKELKFPLRKEEYQAAREAVIALQVYTAQYLEYKKGQKLELVEGMPVGRTANERRRIAAAQEAIKLAETLDFLIQYQQGDPEAAGYIQRQKNSRLEANADRLKKRENKVPVVSTQVETYPEEERGKTSREELENNVHKLYEDMPACAPSDAGSAMVKLREEVPEAVKKVIGFSVMSRVLGKSSLGTVKDYMAKVVLFDYILRERMGNVQPGNEGNIVAGPVERALNKGLINHQKLAKSPEFNAILGKFNPARAEAFLNNDESRNKVFDDAVRGVLSPVKANGMANQPAQPQAQAEMNQVQVQPQPEPSKPVAPNMGGPG